MEIVRSAVPKRSIVEGVPRYYEPYVNDCFYNAYGALLGFKGVDPALALADYLSFLYDPMTEQIGVNYMLRSSDTFYYTEEELNTSLPYAHLQATKEFSGEEEALDPDAPRYEVRLYTHPSAEVAEQRLKERLAEGEPMIVVVNLYEIPYHGAYQKQHGIHAVVVTGYDEEQGVYHLFDKYEMSNSNFDGTLPRDVVEAGRSTSSVTENPVSGTTVRQMEHLWMEVQVPSHFQLKEGSAKQLLSESRRRMEGRDLLLGYPCGFPAMDDFLEALQAKRSRPFDDTEKRRFRFYYNRSLKTIVRQRRRFLVFLQRAGAAFGWTIPAEAKEWLEEAALRWDIAANVALKLGLTGKLALLDDFIEQLRLARAAEEQLVSWLPARE
ncbi:BtrH N-terminal domain-containing protein [Gorillibacterium sp. CAU 1737]|uniref:BtrH N-terminal domain-containing protein n=1 Tax=Gorillibacterium sp. CAU 1737 TaxID=3140362 RepID=UPI0032601CA5